MRSNFFLKLTIGGYDDGGDDDHGEVDGLLHDEAPSLDQGLAGDLADGPAALLLHLELGDHSALRLLLVRSLLVEPDALDQHRGTDRHRQLGAQGGGDEADGEDDHPFHPDELLDEGAQLVNRELGDLALGAIGPSANKQDQLRDHHRSQRGEGDASLRALDISSLGHRSPEEQVEPERSCSDQTEQDKN